MAAKQYDVLIVGSGRLVIDPPNPLLGIEEGAPARGSFRTGALDTFSKAPAVSTPSGDN